MDKRDPDTELKNRLEHHGLLREMIDLRWKYKDTPAGFQSRREFEETLLDWQREDQKLRKKGMYSVKSVKPEKMQQFVGRREELAFIHKNLEEGKGPVLLYGMGGVGKTAIVSAYAEQYGHEYENVLFLYYDGSIRSLLTDDNRVQIRELLYQPEDFSVFSGDSSVSGKRGTGRAGCLLCADWA